MSFNASTILPMQIGLGRQDIITLRLTTRVSSALSTFDSLYIVVSFILFKSIRTTYSVLVFWLSICDLGSSLAWIVFGFVEKSDSSPFCIAQGAVVEFFQIGSFFWTASIAYSMYLIIVKKEAEISYIYKYFHAMSWCTGSIIIGVGIPMHWFGDANITDGSYVSWCWFAAGNDLEKFLFYYLPFFVIWSFNAITYLIVHIEMRKQIISESLRDKTEQRIRLYLLVFMICIGVGVVNRVQNLFGPPLFWLSFIDALFSPLQGFLNSIVYGLSRQQFLKWKELIKYIYSCSCIWNRKVDELTTRMQTKEIIRTPLIDSNINSNPARYYVTPPIYPVYSTTGANSPPNSW